MQHLVLAFLPCTALLLHAAAGAQAPTFIAYPLDATTGNQANNGPLGRNPSGSTDEVRAQIAIPAAFLPPTGGTVIGIEVAASGASSLPYTSLTIQAANLPRTTAFPALNATFATNLGTAPATVFSQTAFSINWLNRQWVRITFSTTFQYQGGDHLVLDFTKVVPGTATGSTAHVIADDRSPYDLPIMMVSFGASGSGAHLSPVNTSTGTRQPPRLRVLFQGVPTTVVASSPYWPIGSPFTLTTQLAIGSPAWQLIDLAGAPLSARNTPFTVPGIGGLGWVVPGPALAGLFVGVSTSNAITTTISVPNNPRLRGQVIVFQSVVADPVLSLVATNATDGTLR